MYLGLVVEYWPTVGTCIHHNSIIHVYLVLLSSCCHYHPTPSLCYIVVFTQNSHVFYFCKQVAKFFNSYGKGGKILSPHLVKEMLLPGM